MNLELFNGYYVAISAEYTVYLDNKRVFIRHVIDGKEFVISPVMGLILSWFTGQETLDEIYRKAESIFSGNVPIKQYIAQIGDFFGDLFVFSVDPIEGLHSLHIDSFNLAKLQPIYFDILLANRRQGPKKIVFNTTNKCNFHCVYCYNKRNMGKTLTEQRVSLECLKEFFSQAKAKGCEKVILTGGDPLLHPQIIEIISILHNMDITTFLSTKTPVDGKQIERLVGAGLSEFQYSIDSLNDQINFQLLGIHISAKQILDSLKAIAKAGIPYKIKCVVTSSNIKDIPDMLKKLLEKGVDNIAFNLYQGIKEDVLAPQQNELEELIDSLKKYADGKTIIEYDFSKKRHICGSLVHTLYLNENGETGVCFKDFGIEELKLGNINAMSLNEIWNGKRAIELLTPDSQIFVDKKCRECNRFQKCVYYGCYFERYELNGTPFSKMKECI